ncbi:hypothetical protein ACPA9J_15240 [Pseudomonas aeruginosa]
MWHAGAHQPAPPPTRHCAADGTVHSIGGSGGIPLRGSAQVGWTDIGDRRPVLEVLRIWWSSPASSMHRDRPVARVHDGTRPSETKVPAGKSVYYAIDAKPEVMWVVGDAECVLSYDGGRSGSVSVCPEN